MSTAPIIPDPIISLKGVWAAYEDDSVLEDINFDVYQGDYVGLIGPNGGGKTTLIKVILGLIKPFRGSITVMGLPPQQGRRNIGYIAQLPSLDKDFPITAWEVVAMGRLGYSKHTSQGKLAEKAILEEKLTWVGMLAHARRPMGELSGGQRQRVYIARALATEPAILLLDEPATGVDTETSMNLFELLRKLNEKVTMVLISHDMTAISTYVRTIGCLNRRLIYHREKQITGDMMTLGYDCPVDLIAHGIPHRVLPTHQDRS